MHHNGHHNGSNAAHRLAKAKNVLGGELKTCSRAPLTGFYRDGCCNTGPEDVGLHMLCAQVTEEFLLFSRANGNDLITPMPQFDFSGLKPGDKWCLCVLRWAEALEAGVAPPVDLEATHVATLDYVSLETLQKYALKSQ
jgi:hypothetical protein